MIPISINQTSIGVLEIETLLGFPNRNLIKPPFYGKITSTKNEVSIGIQNRFVSLLTPLHLDRFSHAVEKRRIISNSILKL
jgi:hypothetical protein